jgi:hypothetical protein
MRRFALVIAAAAAVTAALNATPAFAQAVRTFVSGHGTDSGTCGVGSPCRTFAYALTQTAAGGEITVLDSAGYGTVTIAQSLTITNPGGVEAGITATSNGNAITIDTAMPASITLRGLTLEGGGVGTNGIDVNSVVPLNTSSTLEIIGCVVKDFSNGIAVAPGSSGNTGANPMMNVLIADSYLLNNSSNGVQLQTPSVTAMFALVERTTMINNAVGIDIAKIVGTTSVALVDVRAAGNGTGVNNGGDVSMKNSVIVFSHATFDVLNNGDMALFNNNLIGSLDNQTPQAYSDGTNAILFLAGNALTKEALQ